MEAPAIKITKLNNGYLIDKTILKTEDSYVAESLDRLHEIIAMIYKDKQ